MKSYHFDVGDSHPGPIGYCARVNAENKAKAVEILRAAIELNNGTFEVICGDDVEYLSVYLNADFPTVENIDNIEHVDDVESS